MPSNSPNPWCIIYLWPGQQSYVNNPETARPLLSAGWKACPSSPTQILHAPPCNRILMVLHVLPRRKPGAWFLSRRRRKRDAKPTNFSNTVQGKAGGGKKWNQGQQIFTTTKRMQDWHRDPGTCTNTHLLLFLFFKLQEKCWNRIWTWPWGNWALILTEHFPKPINAELPFWSNHKADRRGVRVWSDLLWVVPGVQM